MNVGAASPTANPTSAPRKTPLAAVTVIPNVNRESPMTTRRRLPPPLARTKAGVARPLTHLADNRNPAWVRSIPRPRAIAGRNG